MDFDDGSQINARAVLTPPTIGVQADLMLEQISNGREGARRHSSLKRLELQRVPLQTRNCSNDLGPDFLAFVIALLE